MSLGDTRIRPLRLAQTYAYAFLFEGGGRRVLIVPDELLGWAPPAEVKGVDLAVLPKGLDEFDPFSGDRRIPESHFVLKTEATFRQTLEVARALRAGRVVMTHIEEPDRLSYDDLRRLEGRLQDEGSERFLCL